MQVSDLLFLILLWWVDFNPLEWVWIILMFIGMYPLVFPFVLLFVYLHQRVSKQNLKISFRQYIKIANNITAQSVLAAIFFTPVAIILPGWIILGIVSYFLAWKLELVHIFIGSYSVGLIVFTSFMLYEELFKE